VNEIYFENHANTRVDERVIEVMLPYFREYYGNAQSIHSLGAHSRDAIEKARSQVAQLIGGKESEIYFTSSASEANNLAIKGVAEAYRQKGRHVIVSEIEHFSVLNAARRLSQHDFEVTLLPVDRNGLVSPEDLQKAIREDTVLVSVQHANPEIGTIQPLAEIASLCRARNIPFHADAVCTAGIIPLDVTSLGVDLLTLSGAQFYGPKGAAALFLRQGVRIVPQIDGGIQENGRRAGTENVPAIVGFGAACEIAGQEMDDNYRRLLGLRNRLITALPEKIPYLYVNGHPEKRLPNNVNISVEFVEGEGMFLFLDQKGIYVSSGSACASKALKMSHVLTAIKVDTAVGQGSILLTLSRYNTDADVDYLLAEFPPIVARLREMSPLYGYFQKTGQRRAAGPGTDYEHEHEHEHDQNQEDG
jgi:cysteine desulfurase